MTFRKTRLVLWSSVSFVLKALHLPGSSVQCPLLFSFIFLQLLRLGPFSSCSSQRLWLPLFLLLSFLAFCPLLFCSFQFSWMIGPYIRYSIPYGMVTKNIIFLISGLGSSLNNKTYLSRLWAQQLKAEHHISHFPLISSAYLVMLVPTWLLPFLIM